MDNNIYSQSAECCFTFGSSTGYEPDGFSKHYHCWFEIYRLTEGACQYFVENQIYDLVAGDILLIPPYHTHKNYYNTAPYSRCVLYITDAYVSSFLNELIEKKGFAYRIPELFDEISEIFKKIEHEYLHWDPCSNYIVGGYAQILAGLFLRNPNRYINDHASSNAHIDETIKYMKKNFSSNITLSQVANEISISPEHLARLFKQETGMTFHNYLTNIRFKEAEIMLKQRDKPISAIAFACGFNDSNYFSTKFRNIYGISPINFRNQFISIQDNEQDDSTPI